MDKLILLLVVIFCSCEPSSKDSQANKFQNEQIEEIKYIQFGQLGGSMMPKDTVISYRIDGRTLQQVRFYSNQTSDTTKIEEKKFQYAKSLFEKFEPELITFSKNKKSVKVPNNDSNSFYLKVCLEDDTFINIKSGDIPNKMDSYKNICWDVIRFLSSD